MCSSPQTTAGFVALVGRPNVGKSSFLNCLLQQKVSIVSPKVQTTRHKIKGIHTIFDKESTPSSQIVFVDLPGIHKPLDELGEKCSQAALEGVQESDAIVFMIEAQEPIPTELKGGDLWITQWLKQNAPQKPIVIAINKIDRIKSLYTPNTGIKSQPVSSLIEKYHKLFTATLKNPISIIPMSANDNINVSECTELCLKHLPHNDLFYPPDVPTDKSIRFLASELIREQLLLSLSDELPHSTTVVIKEFEEPTDKNLTKIYAQIIVERESQKIIIIGNKGQMIKNIGIKARQEIESQLVDTPVYLDLHVKVSKKWRKNPQQIKQFGYE